MLKQKKRPCAETRWELSSKSADFVACSCCGEWARVGGRVVADNRVFP